MVSAVRLAYKNIMEKHLYNILMPFILTIVIMFSLAYACLTLSDTTQNDKAFEGKTGTVSQQEISAGEGGATMVNPAPDWGPLEPYEHLIKECSRKYGVETALVRALIMHESEGNEKLVSRAGALGLMQCMPDKFAPGEDPFNPRTNIKRGTQYLANMLDRFGTVRKAVAAYNAGPGAVEKYGGVPPYKETRAFVPRVVKSYLEYKPKKNI